MSKQLLRRLLLVSAAAAIGLSTATAVLAAEPQEKWCSDVKIAAFPGGPQGGPFAQVVYNGYRQAEVDTGAQVQYYFSNWDPALMITQLQQAIATKVDGIAFMGHPGDDATDALVDQAYAQGTIVTTANTALPKAQDKYSANGMGYVGAPNYSAGHALGAEAAKRAEIAAGDKVFVWGLKAAGGDRGQRTVGVIEALEEAGATVIYQEIDAATNADANAGTATFVGLMKSNPGIKIVVTDHGALTSNVGVYAQAASLQPGDVYFAGFDMSPNTAQAIQSGFQNLVIDQQPFLQGYLSLVNICLTKKFGFSGLHIDTAGAFVDAENVDAISALAAEAIR